MFSRSRDPRDTLARFLSAISAEGAAEAFRPLPREGTRLATSDLG